MLSTLVFLFGVATIAFGLFFVEGLLTAIAVCCVGIFLIGAVIYYWYLEDRDKRLAPTP